MLGRAQLGSRAGQRRVRLDEIGRRVERAAVLARVAVLILGSALRAGALDVAIRQEHRLDRVVELLDRLGVDERPWLSAGGRCPATVRRSPANRSNASGRSSGGSRPVSSGASPRSRATSACGVTPSASALSMIGAPCASSAQTKCTSCPLHPLEAHPDVGLDVFHDVADMERAVRVRQRRGDEEFSVCRVRRLGSDSGGHRENLAMCRGINRF